MRLLRSVIRNLDMYGQAISDVRFLLQRSEFHLLLRASQRSNLRKRMRSRVTHGTFSFLAAIRRLGFRLLASRKRDVHWFSTVAFLPAALCRGTHRNAIQLAMYYVPILSLSGKSGSRTNGYERAYMYMFQETSLIPRIREESSL